MNMRLQNKVETFDKKPQQMELHGTTVREDLFCKDSHLFVGPPRRCKDRKPLPIDFKPTPYSVIVGRGKVSAAAIGNRRLRVLASTFLRAYSEGNNKHDKTVIVSRLIGMVREASPVGAFIKFTCGRWWEVDDLTSREKVGYVLRELLHDKYRSSSKAKGEKRRMQKNIEMLQWATANKRCLPNGYFLENASKLERSITKQDTPSVVARFSSMDRCTTTASAGHTVSSKGMIINGELNLHSLLSFNPESIGLDLLPGFENNKSTNNDTQMLGMLS